MLSTATAVRETFEEMDYHWRQLPLDLITRVPEAWRADKGHGIAYS